MVSNGRTRDSSSLLISFHVTHRANPSCHERTRESFTILLFLVHFQRETRRWRKERHIIVKKAWLRLDEQLIRLVKYSTHKWEIFVCIARSKFDSSQELKVSKWVNQANVYVRARALTHLFTRSFVRWLVRSLTRSPKNIHQILGYAVRTNRMNEHTQHTHSVYICMDFRIGTTHIFPIEIIHDMYTCIRGIFCAFV